MSLIAITRPVSASIVDAQLTFMGREQIDVEKAISQHRDYENYLRKSGAELISLPVEPALPDAVFVEDPVIVLEQIAILTPMGISTRIAEIERLLPAISLYRPIKRLSFPAKLEGGDVLRIGKTLYTGQSTRTDAKGIEQLRNVVEEYGYTVVPVKVTGCLHLKTGVTYLGENSILINSNWVDAGPFKNFWLIEVPIDEPFGANTLTIKGNVLLPASFPKTHSLLVASGFTVDTIDISELQKAEAGLTCMSVVFEN